MAASGDVGGLRRYAKDCKRLAIRVPDMSGRIYDEDRHVGRYGVQIVHGELAIRSHHGVVESERAIPLARWNFTKPTFERREKGDERSRLRIACDEHVRDDDFINEMHVRLDEAGQNGSASDVDDLGLWPTVRHHVRLRSDRGKSTARDGDAIGNRLTRSHRSEATVDQDDVGGTACRHRGAHGRSRDEASDHADERTSIDPHRGAKRVEIRRSAVARTGVCVFHSGSVLGGRPLGSRPFSLRSDLLLHSRKRLCLRPLRMLEHNTVPARPETRLTAKQAPQKNARTSLLVLYYEIRLGVLRRNALKLESQRTPRDAVEDEGYTDSKADEPKSGNRPRSPQHDALRRAARSSV